MKKMYSILFGLWVHIMKVWIMKDAYIYISIIYVYANFWDNSLCKSSSISQEDLMCSHWERVSKYHFFVFEIFKISSLNSIDFICMYIRQSVPTFYPVLFLPRIYREKEVFREQVENFKFNHFSLRQWSSNFPYPISSSYKNFKLH